VPLGRSFRGDICWHWKYICSITPFGACGFSLDVVGKISDLLCSITPNWYDAPNSLRLVALGSPLPARMNPIAQKRIRCAAFVVFRTQPLN